MSIFRFDFVPEAELAPKNVILTPGDASFKVAAIFDKKKDGTPLKTMDGSPKITMSLNVVDCTGNTGYVFDDLTPKTAWKIKGVMDAVGRGDLYRDTGEFSPEDLLHCTGKCVIETKSSPGYDDRTQIKKYLKREESTKQLDYSDAFGLEEIPF